MKNRISVVLLLAGGAVLSSCSDSQEQRQRKLAASTPLEAAPKVSESVEATKAARRVVEQLAKQHAAIEWEQHALPNERLKLCRASQ